MPQPTDPPGPGTCKGNREDHCCHLGTYGVCMFLAENAVDGRRWSCSLRTELGSWDAVHSDERYLLNVRPKLDSIGIAVDCGNWPPPGTICGTCGVSGDD